MNKRGSAAVLICLTLVLAASCAGDRSRELELVRRQIRSILELPAYEYVYHEVIYLGKEASFLGFRTQDKRLLFSVDMRVQAGIRLNDGLDLRPRGGGKIDVRLPAPEVLVIDADEESINQYFILERGGAITQTEFYDEIEASKSGIMQDAIARGILTRAGENARDLIRSILIGAGYTKVTFLTFEAAGDSGAGGAE